MLRFLSDEFLWKELRKLSIDRKRRLLIAAPYVGADTTELVQLRRGDVLVVALTEANSRNGSVCPHEIERLQEKGVEVFLAPDLHAKVMLCGGKAVVGSANLSQTSLKYRDEAAIVVTDRRVVQEVRDWFGQRMSEPVTPEWLSICAKAYKPPKFDETFNRKPKVTRNVRQRMGRGVWLVGLSPMEEYPENEASIFEKGQEEAEKHNTDKGKYEIRPARFVGSSLLVENIRRGDSWIAVWKDGREHYAEEPARVTSWRKGKNKAGKIVTYIFVESSRRPKQVGWGEFKAGCRRAGLKLGRHVVYRQISNPQQAAKVLMLVSKKHVRS